MADKIINCRQIKDSTDTTTKKWLILYEFDDGAGSTKHWEAEVDVTADAMTDGEDANEAKTKANTKASAEKTAWVAAMAAADKVTPSDALNGDVTL
jgi:hypothetical protein